MRHPRTLAIAASTALLLAMAACDSETGTINGDSDRRNYDDPDGLPATTMYEWDGACDNQNVDEIFELFGHEEFFGDGPTVDQNYGEGNHNEALNCEAMVVWPTMESPITGSELTSDGTIGLFLYPEESVFDAESRFNHERNRYNRSFGSWDQFVDEEIDGPWNRGHLYGHQHSQSDTIYWFIHTDDFVFSGHVKYLTDDPGLAHLEHLIEIGAFDDEEAPDPSELQFYEFDREAAQSLLVEEFLPNLNQTLLNQLER